MGWRFRKSFKVIPGVRINLSRRGLSTTIGTSPFSVNLSSRGIRSTATIPGAGISFSSSHTAGRQTAPAIAPVSAQEPGTSPERRAPQPLDEIRSASTEAMTTEGLRDLRRVLAEAEEERRSIANDLTTARRENDIAGDRYRRWNEGFLFKHIWTQNFARRRETAEQAAAKLAELDEQLRLTTIATQIDIDPEQAEPFYRLRDQFADLAKCLAIWDTVSEGAVDQRIQRTAAKRGVNRVTVTFSLKKSELINWEQPVPHLQNANGGDIYLYPGFILFSVSRFGFSLIDFSEVNLASDVVGFIETDPIPSDAEIHGHTWLKANKDGSPDRRFANNRKIPIARYGRLKFTSVGGLNEEYQCSNAARTERFAQAWEAFRRSLGK